MKRLLKTSAAVLLAAFCCGCGEDDDRQLFEGSDNRILSFTLTSRDGALYRGAITGERIVVTAPENVSLEGASASCEVCECAVLYPDPASLSDWDNEHLFRVVAHNGAVRDYAYSVERTAVGSASVTLLTQADVAAFAATGATVIEGSLTIGGRTTQTEDPVTDLSPLAALTDVRYNIVVNDSFAGERISLPGLRTVGSLQLGSVTTELAAQSVFDVSLPALETLGSLTLCSASVGSLSLPALTSVGSLYVDSPSLAYADLSSLAECTGDLSLFSGTSAATGNKALTALSLPSLERVSGSLSMQYLTAVAMLDLPHLVSVGGSCTFSNLTSLKALSLPVLSELGGSFTWSYLTAVTTFSLPKLTGAETFSLTDNTSSAMLASVDLPLLASVRGNLTVQTRFSGEELSLPALRSVGGQLKLANLAALLRLDLPSLTACGSIYLTGLSQLGELDLAQVGCPFDATFISCYALATVKVQPETLNNVTLNGGSHACDFTRLEGARRIAGTLTVSNYTQNDELAFPGLHEIGTYTQSNGKSGGAMRLSFPDLERVGTMKLTSCTWLGSLSAPCLEEVTELWETKYMQYVEAGDLQLPALRRIGTFSFEGGSYASAYNNMLLTSLDDFAAVTQISSVKINGWGRLTDFSGLRNALPSLSAGAWAVTNCSYNPTWQQMLDGQYVKP